MNNMSKNADYKFSKIVIPLVFIAVVVFSFIILASENGYISYTANLKNSTGELYSKDVNIGKVKFTYDNEMESTFLDDSLFKMKYNNQNITSIKENKKNKDKFITESKKVKTKFYEIKKNNNIVTNSIRYINRSFINSSEMVTSYALFQYSDNSVPTIISYIPKKGYVFYGNGNYFRDLKVKNNYSIIRYKTEKHTSCPVIVSDGNAIVIEFHKEGLNDTDVDIFYNAIQRAVGDYGITNIKKSNFYTAEHMIYYRDGLSIKQIGRLTRDGDTIIFFMYLEKPDKSMFDDLTIIAKIKQNWFTDIGGLRDLNPIINFSIKEKIVEYFLEEKGYNYYVGNFTIKEESIKSLLAKETLKKDWLIDANWGSPYIEPEKESYEYSVILKEKPITNVVEFDINTSGLNFYYQPKLTEQDRLNGEFRPSSVEGSYAVYYDNNRKNGKYKTGKVMHIYRPKVIDNESNWQWADLNIDKKLGKLTITINQSFLDNAVYPVIIDPTLGYTTAGGSYDSDNIHNSSIAGSVFSGVSGEVTSLTAYTYKKDVDDIYFRGAIYDNATGNLITNGETENLYDNTSDETVWRTMNFPISPIISSGTDYILALTSDDLEPDSNPEYLYYDIIDSTLTGIENTTAGGNYSVNGFPANLEFTRNNKTYSIYVNYTEPVTDTTPPTYSDINHNSTIAGESALFSSLWNDDTALHTNGQYTFSTNNTGVWVNDSAINFTVTPSWANVTKTLNSTSGLSIGYRWYATDNLGNTNDTGIQVITTTSTDTCTCPGIASNWEIDLSDTCSINSDCNLSTGNITFINTGSVLFNATLTANKISWKDSVAVVEKYNLGNNFRGFVG